MKRHFLLTSVAVIGLAVTMIAIPTVSAAQAPPMGGERANAIAIPVDDPVGMIAGALFEPKGAGPFPAVVLLGDCGPVGGRDDAALEKTAVERDLSRGFATLIVDSFTARGRVHGVCDSQTNPVWLGVRAADAHAAKDALAGRADVDARAIFLVGYGHGGSAALLAADAVTAAKHKARFAGVVAYYPYCGFACGCDYAFPTLVLSGAADGVAPADRCRSLQNKANVELVVIPGAAHAFAAPGVDRVEDGQRLLYDAKAADEAEARADAFLAAHMK